MSVLFLANFTRSKTFKSPWWSKGGTSDIITCPTVSERHWVMRWNIKQGIRKLFYFYPDPDIFPALFSTSRKILISYHRQERQVWSSKPQRTCKEGRRSLQAMGKGLFPYEFTCKWVGVGPCWPKWGVPPSQRVCETMAGDECRLSMIRRVYM